MVVMIESKNMETSPELSTTDDAVKMGQKRQCLTFSEQVRSRETYSSDEIQDCWYSEKDYNTFRREILETIELMKHNVYIDDVRYCQRGLEKYFEDADLERRQVQAKARFAVMKGQEMGKGMNLENSMSLSDSIAHHYSMETRSPRMAAYLTGIADERYVRLATFSEEEPLLKVARPQAMRVDLPPKAAAGCMPKHAISLAA